MKANIYNIIKTIVYLFMIIIFLLFLTYYKQPKDQSYQNIRGFYAENENTLDAIYYGGSASFVYYEPLKGFADKGIALYNYGANTMQAELYKLMINESLKTQDPSLLIIDARAFQYRDKDQKPTTVAYRNVLTGTKLSKDKIKWINENIPKYLGDDADSLSSYYFDLMLYHTTTDNLIEPSIDVLFEKNNNIYKGFHFIIKSKRIEKEKFLTKKVTAPSDETDKILDDLLDYLKTLDKDVLFVVSPYTIIESEKSVFNYVERKVEKAGFDFLDVNEYRDEIGINFDTDFYDFNHVNIFGAEKYTDFLSSYIKDNYKLPDRRNDKKYSSWNDALPQWRKDVKQTKEKIKAIIESEKYNENIANKQ